MNRIIILISGYLFIHSITFAQTPTHHNDRNWQLKWKDDFNSLNTDMWFVKNNFDHNGKPSVYLAQNAYINNDTLVLRSKKEPIPYCCPPGYLNEWGCKKQWKTDTCYQYTGAWIETQPTYNTQYGYLK